MYGLVILSKNIEGDEAANADDILRQVSGPATGASRDGPHKKASPMRLTCTFSDFHQRERAHLVLFYDSLVSLWL